MVKEMTPRRGPTRSQPKSTGCRGWKCFGFLKRSKKNQKRKKQEKT